MKKYIANHHTKQIHRVGHLKQKCNANPTKSYQKRCGPFVAWFLLTFCGFDGCGHCWPEKSKVNEK